MMLGHDPKSAPGRWRRGSISVWEELSSKPVYRAPHAKFVPALMAEPIAPLNAKDEVPVFIRAGMAQVKAFPSARALSKRQIFGL
jgi:hypothetical protein